MKKFVLLAAAAVILGGTGAQGQDKLKIGVIATLSGPPAVLGQQLRNGFNLAVKTLGGKLGGREVEVIVADDELKPDVAVNKVKALVDRDKVDFVVGPIFSNILAADHEAGDRRRGHPDQPQCRHLQLCRQGMQPELLRHLLPERPGVRGIWQTRAGHRHQEGVPDGAQLPGGQGCARRLQDASSRARSRTRSTCR